MRKLRSRITVVFKVAGYDEEREEKTFLILHKENVCTLFSPLLK